jgi:hypothetical protein
MKIRNEKELIKKLKEDIDITNKKRIVILAGHFPLIYTKECAVEALNKWGEFSIYTLEIGCKIGKYAKTKNKEVKFVFFVDDHIYENVSNLNSWQLSKRREKLYKSKSKTNSKIIKDYEIILKKNGFSEKDIIKQNQNKKGRENCLYFSEKILRSSKKEIKNECAREYIEFLENKNYFNKKEDYIISFIPNLCKTHICDIALNLEIKNLDGTHIFMETMAPLSKRKELYSFGRGISYRKEMEKQL